MAKLETNHVFDGKIEDVFNAIGMYDKYPEYIPGVTSIEVLPAKAAGSKCRVRYELNLIKTFYYVLNMYEEKPGRIWWDLEESNIMKVSNGSWQLTADGDKTKAIYSLEIKFRGLIPSAVTDKIAKTNLPGTMEGFQRLINDL